MVVVLNIFQEYACLVYHADALGMPPEQERRLESNVGGDIWYIPQMFCGICGQSEGCTLSMTSRSKDWSDLCSESSKMRDPTINNEEYDMI